MGERKGWNPVWEGNEAWTGRGLRIDGGRAQGELLGPSVSRHSTGHITWLAPKHRPEGGQRRHLVPTGATAGRRPVMAARAVYTSPDLDTTGAGSGTPSSGQERSAWRDVLGGSLEGQADKGFHINAKEPRK